MEYTIKDLKRIIENLPDDMKIGGSGHFGEFLSCLEMRVESVYKTRNTFNKISEKEDILLINIESAGEEPN